MKTVSGKRFAKVLEEHGWVFERVGSRNHHIYGKEGELLKISVPIHGSADLKTGLLSKLLKLAGLKESDL